MSSRVYKPQYAMVHAMIRLALCYSMESLQWVRGTKADGTIGGTSDYLSAGRSGCV